MVEDVEQRGSQRQRRSRRHSIRAKGKCQAETDEDNADVLDRVIGEKPFEIVLHQSVEHTQQRCRRC